LNERGPSPFLFHGHTTGGGALLLPAPRSPHDPAQREREREGRATAGRRAGDDVDDGTPARRRQPILRDTPREGSSETKGRELCPDGGRCLQNDGQASMTARLAAVAPANARSHDNQYLVG